MNSTVSLLQLWQMCIRSQDDGSENVLQWDTLRTVMAGLPMARCEALKNSSVDEILRQHFGPFGGGARLQYVNFTLFWRGMEAILQTAGVFHGTGLDVGIAQTVASLRSFRDNVLQELPGDPGGGLDGPGAECTVRELRLLYDRLRHTAPSPEVITYWAGKIDELPDDEELVSGDEIACALQRWLEVLLGCGDGSEDGSADSEDEPEQESFDDVRGGRPLSLPPPPGQLVLDRAPMPSQGWDWLLETPWARPGEVEPPEGSRFRDLIHKNLPSWPEDVSLMQFFRAVRDATEADSPASGSFGPSTPRMRSTPALTAGIARLARVVGRQVRAAFRELETKPRTSYDDSVPAPEPWRQFTGGRTTGVIAGLICSQALAAQILDRRASLAPRAFRVAWLLERARRRWVLNVLATLRHGSSGLDAEDAEDRQRSFSEPFTAEPTGTPPLRSPGVESVASSQTEVFSPGRRWGNSFARPKPSAMNGYAFR